MKKTIITTIMIAIGIAPALGEEPSIKITEPANGATVSSPVKVCFAATGIKAMQADGLMHEGEGHHHVLIDRDLPKPGKPMGKWKSVKHLGDGGNCTEIELEPGEHTLTGLFAYGNHIPYDPPITDKITITVK